MSSKIAQPIINMKKVLIITYYWPPSGGSGVQRWLYFSKYLRKFGWEPIIFTAANADYPVIDPSMEAEIPPNLEVIQQSIWEPYTIYKQLVGIKREKGLAPNIIQTKQKRSLLHSASVFLRGNFFIPDARKFWLRPSVGNLTNYLAKNPVDLIVSTSPPQTPHLIALSLKKKFNIPWIADFRDPWTNISYFNELKLTPFAKRKHQNLEREVLQTADKILTVSWQWAEDFKELGAKEVAVITNGFEASKRQNNSNLKNKKTDHFVISHIGMLSEKRNPVHIWEAIKSAINNEVINKKIILRFIGNVEPTIIQQLKDIGLGDHLEYPGYMTREEAFEEMCMSDLLLLIGIPGEKGVVPGKFFEYLQAKKPILSISPEESDVSKLIKELTCGENVDYTNQKGSMELVRTMLVNSTTYQVKEEVIQQFSRKSLTKNLAALFDKVG